MRSRTKKYSNTSLNVDFGASQSSMLYQNLCYIEVYLKYKEKNRICKGNSLTSLNEKIITCKTKCHWINSYFTVGLLYLARNLDTVAKRCWCSLSFVVGTVFSDEIFIIKMFFPMIIDTWCWKKPMLYRNLCYKPMLYWG